ncbi:DNA polymerase III, beta subunit [Candidatus Endolissoclinum faulkneri L2]|uniref:Beta sliding clamp n=1 Tax=Candidatus Endolissoclinum faulkneri L2 TaxID=1193729 RepID=K7ZCX4_9PROT|nr:DNA polymerase III subunit beta [Candidatus Endolissoclinum faulkneri]AFX98966.1 DNA polymerase III, beta subunit [Candidatus Endolissoclinum faulkneri L2]
MKITIDRSSFLKPMAHIQSVVERRNTIPILANVLLQAKAGRLSMTATDMDMDLVNSTVCIVDQPGSITVSAFTLYDIIRKLPNGSEVKLNMDKDSVSLSISAGRSKFLLPTLKADEFPSLPNDQITINFMLSAVNAKSLIDRTRFAISTEESRYYLNGMYLHETQVNNISVLRAVTTDGHRLALMEIPLPESASGIPPVIVPRKAIIEIRKLIDESEGSVHVAFSKNKLRFNFVDTAITTKLIDGNFPDYERVIPTSNDKIMRLECRSLKKAVERIAIISTAKSRSVKLEINKGNLILSAKNPDNAWATEDMNVDYDSDPIEIGFNSRYLLEIANQFNDSATVLFHIADKTSPAIVTNEKNDGALYVIMPMRI